MAGLWLKGSSQLQWSQRGREGRTGGPARRHWSFVVLVFWCAIYEVSIDVVHMWGTCLPTLDASGAARPGACRVFFAAMP